MRLAARDPLRWVRNHKRKKARTRRMIADTAARLFAERGYEHVAMGDEARERGVVNPPLCVADGFADFYGRRASVLAFA